MIPFPLASNDYYGPGHHAGCGAQPDTANVKVLQHNANIFMLGHSPVPGIGINEDGCYGTKTRDWIEQCQEIIRCKVDGLTGPITWNAIQY